MPEKKRKNFLIAIDNMVLLAKLVKNMKFSMIILKLNQSSIVKSLNR